MDCLTCNGWRGEVVAGTKYCATCAVCGNCNQETCTPCIKCDAEYCIDCKITAVYDTDASTVTLSTGKVYSDIRTHTDLQCVVEHELLLWENVTICGEYVSYHRQFHKLKIVHKCIFCKKAFEGDYCHNCGF